MALLDYTSRRTSGGTPGTLNSQGLFYQPPVPGQSQAQGIQGTDGRAYTREVGQNELVNNQLTRLLAQDNPYIKQARQQGLAQAAARGMGNSSIAAGSAQREAIKAGLPIAAQDAQTFANTQAQNMEALNSNLMQERQIANQMLEAEMQLEQARSMADAQLAAAAEDRLMRLQMQREQLAYSGEQQGLDRAFQNFMANQGYQFDLGRAQQGYGFDLGRMGAQDFYQRGQMGLGSLLERQQMADQYGYNRGLAEQGFGFDLARAQQGFGFDMHRMGYQFDLQDRNDARRFQEQIIRDNNTFGNQMYSDFFNQTMQSRIGRSDAAYAFMLQNLYGGELDPETLDGLYSFSEMLGSREFDASLNDILGLMGG